MRNPRSHRFLRAALGVLTLVAGVAVATPAAAQFWSCYTQVDLGTPDEEYLDAMAINDRGEVVGTIFVDNVRRGFLWRDGVRMDLGTLEPWDINNRGQIAGDLRVGDYAHAVLWTRGTVRHLGGVLSHAAAVNDRGDVVGEDWPSIYEAQRTVLWRDGKARYLPLNTVGDINDRGQIAGGMLRGEVASAAVWWHGTITDLDAPEFGRSGGLRINERGWVLGSGITPEPEHQVHGLLWRGTEMIDVGALGGRQTLPVALNDRGQALVSSDGADWVARSALWQDGKLIDLSEYGIVYASDINNKGEIITDRFLIRPTHEPGCPG